MNVLIIISLLAILVLYLGLFKAKKALLPVTIAGLLSAATAGALYWNSFQAPIYSNMLLFDNYAIAFSGICIICTVLLLLLSPNYFERISSQVAEYYALILFALVGIVMILSYHNLAMLFIGIEIMSVALYILAGIKKKDFSSNEASLKYFLMGAFSTGILLFGIALVYGATGSFDLAEIREYVLRNEHTMSPLLYGGMLFLVVGLSFKVGAAPFHFWVPDVYEGSPTLVTAFMSTVVKTAGFGAFLRIILFCFAPVQQFWIPLIVVLAVLSLLVGNITAVYQHHFKRMLAYSSISHVGYMLFAILALNTNSANSVLLYAAAYTVASVIAFSVLILVQQKVGIDTYDGFNGLAKRNPYVAFVLTVAMLSLAGIPLTAGFIGKFMMFSGALGSYHIALVVFAVINAAIGVFYYFRVIIAMYFRSGDDIEIQVPSYYKVVMGISVFITILLGIYPGFLAGLL